MTQVTPRSGFTLLELVVVVAIFGLVLAGAYQTLVSTLETDEKINRVTRSGKIGEAILSLMRRDLQGVIWRGLGNDVFRVEDNGEGESANDTLDFLTTSPVPQPPYDYVEEWLGELASVGYVTSSGEDGQLVLFRRVKWLSEIEDPYDGGRYYPIYERVRSVSFELLDAEAEWVQNWESEERIPEQGNNHETLLELESGESAEDLLADQLDEDLGTETDDEEEIETLVVPRAVRVVLQIYVGDENGVFKDLNGEDIVELYSTVIPILAVESLQVDEELFPEESAAGGGEPDDTPDPGTPGSGAGAGPGSTGPTGIPGGATPRG